MTTTSRTDTESNSRHVPGEIVGDGDPTPAGNPSEDATPTPNQSKRGPGMPNPKKPPRFVNLSDCVAGIRFAYRREPYLAEIRFDEKPDKAIRDHLGTNDFKSNRNENCWVYPIHKSTQEVNRLHAKKIYHQCCEMKRQQLGAEPPSQLAPD
jgi:hypothetical protein